MFVIFWHYYRISLLYIMPFVCYADWYYNYNDQHYSCRSCNVHVEMLLLSPLSCHHLLANFKHSSHPWYSSRLLGPQLNLSTPAGTSRQQLNLYNCSIISVVWKMSFILFCSCSRIYVHLGWSLNLANDIQSCFCVVYDIIQV